jgi:methionyl-tRNA synthetase
MFSQLFSGGNVYTFNMPFPPAVLAVLLIWTLIWKGLVLWKSARNHQIIWFVVLLVVNTIGILEILYLLFFQKKGECCEYTPEEKKNNLISA